jgi:hypothetical protein
MLIESIDNETEEEFRIYVIELLTGIYKRLPDWLEFKVGRRFRFRSTTFREFLCPAGSVSAFVQRRATEAGGISRSIILKGIHKKKPVCIEICAGAEKVINCAELTDI